MHLSPTSKLGYLSFKPGAVLFIDMTHSHKGQMWRITAHKEHYHIYTINVK